MRASDTTGVSPLITIVVPAWNAEATLERALRSVLFQTSDSWALIVVDDGSSDSTSDIAMLVSAGDPRISLVRQHNLGVAAARNRGIELAESPFVAFLDSDDELAPAFVESMSAFIQANPGYEIYHPNLMQIRPDGDLEPFLDDVCTVERTFEDLLDRCIIAAGGAVVAVDALRSARGFAEDLHCEDYDLWLRMTASGARGLYNPEILYSYHQARGGSRSADGATGSRDVIVSMNRLKSCEALSSVQAEQLNRAIALKTEEHALVLMHDDLQAQADALRNRIESIFGPQLGRVVLALAHTFSWVVRPLRKWLLVRGEKKSLLRDKR